MATSGVSPISSSGFPRRTKSALEVVLLVAVGSEVAGGCYRLLEPAADFPLVAAAIAVLVGGTLFLLVRVVVTPVK